MAFAERFIVSKIDIQPFMRWPQIIRLFKAFENHGFALRFVGGCVRNTLAQEEIKDFDFATPALPHQILALLDDAHIKALPTGIEHGTITALIDKKPFEITTLRRDVKGDGRYAEVTFCDDWQMDAMRRDFTFNALYLDSEGHVYDFFDGIGDLKNGIVRFIGDGAARIKEDYLRILRFFRFNAFYGKGAFNQDDLDQCAAAAPHLKQLSLERITSELLNLLTAPNPVSTLRVMQDYHILAQILPPFCRLDLLQALINMGAPLDKILRLKALLPESIDQIQNYLRLSNAILKRLGIKVHLPTPLSTSEQRHYLYRLTKPVYIDALYLNGAQDVAANQKYWLRLLDYAQNTPALIFPIKGQDCLAAGLQSGKEVGLMLKAVESWWESQDYRPDRTSCLAKIKEIASAKS